jgi:hypothetical protein
VLAGEGGQKEVRKHAGAVGQQAAAKQKNTQKQQYQYEGMFSRIELLPPNLA